MRVKGVEDGTLCGWWYKCHPKACLGSEAVSVFPLYVDSVIMGACKKFYPEESFTDNEGMDGIWVIVMGIPKEDP